MCEDVNIKKKKKNPCGNSLEHTARTELRQPLALNTSI